MSIVFVFVENLWSLAKEPLRPAFSKWRKRRQIVQKAKRNFSTPHILSGAFFSLLLKLSHSFTSILLFNLWKRRRLFLSYRRNNVCLLKKEIFWPIEEKMLAYWRKKYLLWLQHGIILCTLVATLDWTIREKKCQFLEEECQYLRKSKLLEKERGKMFSTFRL